MAHRNRNNLLFSKSPQKVINPTEIVQVVNIFHENRYNKTSYLHTFWEDTQTYTNERSELMGGCLSKIVAQKRFLKV